MSLQFDFGQEPEPDDLIDVMMLLATTGVIGGLAFIIWAIL